MSTAPRKFKVSAEMGRPGTYTYHCRQNKLTMFPISDARPAGDATIMNPVELLLSALCGCIGLTIENIASEKKILIRDIRIEIEGERFENAPSVALQEIRTRVTIDSDLDRASLEELLAEAEKQCTVTDTIIRTPVMKVELA